MKLATLCYLKKDSKTLMIHRVKKKNDVHQNKWNGLGGKLAEGETPEECAVREIREECGLQATRLELKGILTFPNFANNEDWYVFVFVVKEFQGELHDPQQEGVLQWIADAQILDLNLWEGDRQFLPLLEKPGVFSGKFVYQEGHLQDYHLCVYP